MPMMYFYVCSRCGLEESRYRNSRKCRVCRGDLTRGPALEGTMFDHTLRILLQDIRAKRSEILMQITALQTEIRKLELQEAELYQSKGD